MDSSQRSEAKRTPIYYRYEYIIQALGTIDVSIMIMKSVGMTSESRATVLFRTVVNQARRLSSKAWEVVHQAEVVAPRVEKMIDGRQRVD